MVCTNDRVHLSDFCTLTPFPDDDPNDDDEDVTVNNQHIYSYDRPQIPVISSEYRFLFGAREFVVVKFEGTRPQPGEGSRCSDKIDWHVDMHLRTPGADELEVDLGKQQTWTPSP